jgi:hypothetical protein
MGMWSLRLSTCQTSFSDLRSSSLNHVISSLNHVISSLNHVVSSLNPQEPLFVVCILVVPVLIEAEARKRTIDPAIPELNLPIANPALVLLDSSPSPSSFKWHSDDPITNSHSSLKLMYRDRRSNLCCYQRFSSDRMALQHVTGRWMSGERIDGGMFKYLYRAVTVSIISTNSRWQGGGRSI